MKTEDIKPGDVLLRNNSITRTIGLVLSNDNNGRLKMFDLQTGDIWMTVGGKNNLVHGWEVIRDGETIWQAIT